METSIEQSRSTFLFALNSTTQSFPEKSERCWQEIGVWGDKSCSQLAAEIHCQNCAVYTKNGRRLFHRPAPSDYLDEWTRLVATEKEAEKTENQSVVVFRVSSEWFGLPTTNFVEVHPFKTIHRIPQMSRTALLGVLNVRGSLHLCVSMRHLLDLPSESPESEWKQHAPETRIAIIERQDDRWACKLDEIDGILQFSREQLHPPPVTVAKATSTFTKGVIRAEKPIALLDDELIFHYLKHNLT